MKISSYRVKLKLIQIAFAFLKTDLLLRPHILTTYLSLINSNILKCNSFNSYQNQYNNTVQ